MEGDPGLRVLHGLEEDREILRAPTSAQRRARRRPDGEVRGFQPSPDLGEMGLPAYPGQEVEGRDEKVEVRLLPEEVGHIIRRRDVIQSQKGLRGHNPEPDGTPGIHEGPSERRGSAASESCEDRSQYVPIPPLQAREHLQDPWNVPRVGGIGQFRHRGDDDQGGWIDQRGPKPGTGRLAPQMPQQPKPPGPFLFLPVLQQSIQGGQKGPGQDLKPFFLLSPKPPGEPVQYHQEVEPVRGRDLGLEVGGGPLPLQDIQDPGVPECLQRREVTGLPVIPDPIEEGPCRNSAQKDEEPGHSEKNGLR
jgi:hypothetical protein